jgi:hypothetical protein
MGNDEVTYNGIDVYKKERDGIVLSYRANILDDDQLWRLLSGGRSPLPYNEAAKVYTELGFVPFSGYPLQRINEKSI